MYLYLILNIASLSIPLIYSFDKKMRFIRHWRAVLLSLVIIASVFLLWDAVFTKNGVWGFNPKYHLNCTLLGMPIEEWLFFFCIPYASIFIHYSFEYFKPNLLLSKHVTQAITIGLILTLIPVIIVHTDKDYTYVNYSALVFLLAISLKYGIKYLQRFYIAFLAILIPFFIVNGILTGIRLDEPIVWYNDEENLGIRIATIPVEDIGYAFTMIFGNIFLIEKFKK
ncbi:MAG: lycopene cyclase domain-containing protein [Flavobacteriaceae bacterium]|nr:MAG: lycopene cyclase domain-containing protein [Flavobacteriaceae bacterium]